VELKQSGKIIIAEP